MKQARLEGQEEKVMQKIFESIFASPVKFNHKPSRLGGMNNKNYLIDTNIGKYVFRLPGEGSNESVDRHDELHNAELTYQIGLNCKTNYFDQNSGIKVTEYIENAETLTIENASKKENMKDMAEALKLLHQSAIRFASEFQPFKEMEQYLAIIKKNKAKSLAEYKGFEEIYKEMLQMSTHYEMKSVPSHLDAWPENFIKGDQKIYLVDWEYSANFDPLWDVTSISLECEYDFEQKREFNSYYFEKEPSDSEKEKMFFMEILMDLYWSLWALAKVSCGDLTLLEYGINRFERGKTHYNSFKEKQGE